MKKNKLSSPRIYLLIGCLFILLASCKKDEETDYPITATFAGLESPEPKRVFTKSNGEIIEVPLDQTLLDTDDDWQDLEAFGMFAFIRFDSDEAAAYSFLFPQYAVAPDTVELAYTAADGRLSFTPAFGAAVNVPLQIEGEPSNFRIASEAILLRNNPSGRSFLPNYFRLGPDFYTNSISEGDTVVIMNYWQRYQAQ